ncbi:MAG: hypothetical protein C0600_13600 [Ignavibacteria bacterium]|nr:MAG: hypothetical protein C0600_13600 [Ignavibacteria bacterium]
MTSNSDVPSENTASHDAASRRTGSVLDKYPERDLSHLTGSTPPPPTQDDIPPSPPETMQSASPGAITEPESPGTGNTAVNTSSDEAASETGQKAQATSSKWPLFALLGVVLFLLLIAFIWHVNPWPPLKDSISALFTSSDPVEAVIPATEIDAEAEMVPEPAVRSWDYFIQVSSWPDLAKADLDAERFRAQGFDVIVESEFIPSKGGTYYRVRLGPYENAAEAEGHLAQHATALPAGAFVDSTRLAEDEIIEEVVIDEPALPMTTRPRRNALTAAADIVTEPMNGWAVKVSSFKSDDIARNEARKLLEQGYPSFITRKRIGAATWYRVLVGPFSQKDDANRYMQLLNVTYGNEAYTVDLASY